MKIAPIDIAHKTFSRKVMGLDADEVSDFMRDVADQMEEVVRERNLLKEALRQKDLQIMEYKERDDSLKATLGMATKMSEQIRGDSEREAKLIVNDAHQKAEMILKDSRDSLKRVYQEIADLKRVRMQFEVNLRAVCQAHVAMLDQSHVAMPDPQINLAHAQASLGMQSQNLNGGQNQNQSQNQNQNQGQQMQYNQAPQQAQPGQHANLGFAAPQSSTQANQNPGQQPMMRTPPAQSPQGRN